MEQHLGQSGGQWESTWLQLTMTLLMALSKAIKVTQCAVYPVGEEDDDFIASITYMSLISSLLDLLTVIRWERRHRL